jgi:curved DNA-binding protein CbpA
MTEKSPYDILGVTSEAEETVIDAAYQSLVKKHHPDQGGEQQKFQQIQQAYQEIKNSESLDENSNNSGQDIDSLFEIFYTPIDTEAVTGKLSDGLALQGDHLTMGITNITRADISEYVFPSDEYPTDNQLIVTSHVANDSDYVQQFKPYELRIITEDGQQYDACVIGFGEEGFDLSGDTKPLPNQLYGKKRKMEPHTKANFISVIENIPESVDIDRVIYPFKLFDGHQTDGVVKSKTRYVFDILPQHWQEFALIAEGELEAPSEESYRELDEAPSPESKLEIRGDANEPAQQSQTSTEPNDTLTEQDAGRIEDIIELQPTTNSQLQKRWDMDSGSEVHQYLEDVISNFYERNSNKKIVATNSAERLINDG